jgi:cell division transport system permease protein
MEFLGFNPLQNSFDIHLKSDYVTKEEIKKIENNLKETAIFLTLFTTKNW